MPDDIGSQEASGIGKKKFKTDSQTILKYNKSCTVKGSRQAGLEGGLVPKSVSGFKILRRGLDKMITVDGRKMFTTLEELVNPEYTALLLIDIQNDYCSPGGHADKMGTDMSMLQEVPARVKPVLEAARRYGVLVIHTQQTHYPKHMAESGAWLRMIHNIRRAAAKGCGKTAESAAYLFRSTVLEGTWGWQEVDEIAAQPGEIIIKKHRSSAFIGTDLDMILHSNGIKSVVSVGVATEGCVESTARSAQFFDYYSVLLRDCVASTTRQMHKAALLVMNRLDVVDSSQVMKVWAER